MVKIGMVEEYDVRRVAVSNSVEVMRQLHEGGERIRLAAKAGHDSMREVLASFASELEGKTFSGTSSDALAAGGRLLVTESDEEAVLRLMEEATQQLPQFWKQKVRAQQMRQLLIGGKALSMEELQGSDFSAHVCASEESLDPLGPFESGWKAPGDGERRGSCVEAHGGGHASTAAFLEG
eukprot:CAMPEP_0179202870 /NCGR_PEP_ID=MMETSP0796-20121207/101077_1 /TAXON_ID=73915 /ORGANISM="Pyrodinium bahamense, Strain pbaha01" /LENGTH=179 /DNA_ID=CAMNT_0020907643 /DNA_START=88 /DNA_END=623 /DNA_ORIENTATION=+